MAANAPWSVKGIDPKAREIAKDLARRSGMTLGEWLNQMIIEDGTAAEDARPPPAHERYEAPDHPGDDVLRAADALDRLSARIEAAEHRSTLAISGIDQSVAGILTRMDAAEREQTAVAARFEGAVADVAAEQARLGGRLVRIEQDAQGPRSVEAMRSMEAALAKVAGHLFDGETRADQRFADLKGELDGLAARIAEQPGSPTDAQAQSIERIADRVTEAELRTSAAMTNLEASFARLDERLGATEGRLGNVSNDAGLEQLAASLSARVDAVRAEMADKIREAADGRFERMERTLGEMTGHVEAAERRSAQAIERMGHEVLRMADTLGRQVQEVDHRSADAIEQVGGEVARIADAVEVRLAKSDDSSARALEKLGGEIARITERLAERIANAERRSAQAMDDVGEQVARVSERLSDRHERTATELAERIRLSEERTARLLEDARERIDQRLSETQRQLEASAPSPRHGPVGFADPDLEPFGRQRFDTPAAPFEPPAFREDAYSTPAAERRHDDPAIFADDDDLPPRGPDTRGFLADDDDLLEPASVEDDDDVFATPAAAAEAAAPPVLPEPDLDLAAEPIALEASPVAPTPEPAPAFDALAADAAAAHEPLAEPHPEAEAPTLAHADEHEPAAAAEIDIDPAAAAEAAETPPAAALSTRELIEQARAAARAANMSPAEQRADRARRAEANTLFGGGTAAKGKPKRRGSSLGTALFVSGAAAALGVALVGYELVLERPANAPRTAANAQGAPLPGERNAPGEGPSPLAAVALSPTPDHPGLTPAAPNAQQTEAAAELYADAIRRITAHDNSGADALRRAANLGYAPAEFYLAKLYESGGAGIKKDPVQARAWTERAAEAGDPKAMHNLALDYFEGQGGPKDSSLAASWFRKAADLGLVDSQYNLARLYEEGFGVPRNPAEAYKWYLIAAHAGDADSRTAAQRLKAQISPEAQAAAERAAQGFQAQAARPGAPTSTVAGSTDIATAQHGLSRLGYYQGPYDGVSSPALSLAIAAFQRDQGLPSTGALDPSVNQRLAAAAQ
ncbi:MAG TPA: peptidoglycan-binding protein [Caulobacteraceae bacterium]|nr:peptidoglycan-binding protein [Caulobacteraceae bacterium]